MRTRVFKVGAPSADSRLLRGRYEIVRYHKRAERLPAFRLACALRVEVVATHFLSDARSRLP